MKPQKDRFSHPSLTYYRPEFADIIGDHYGHRVLVETSAHEGPVYVRATEELYFTTVPQEVDVPMPGYKQVAIRKVGLDKRSLGAGSPEVVTVREPSNMANGMTLDLDGRLLICEQGTKSNHARISSMDLHSGKVETVVDEWFGLRFNSPNDIVVKRDDRSIWFTDPAYGYPQGFKNAPLIGNYVYRYDRGLGQASVVADSFLRPNGLAFSPGQDSIYINDSAALLGDDSGYHVDNPHHIKAFDLLDGRFLTNERLFAVVTPGIPDGLKLDTWGNVYSSSASGIKVYSPAGALLGEISAPGVANFTFGGLENNILYACVDTAILEIQIAAVGAADYNG